VAKKKSYMNNENILSEGFFNKLANILGLSSSEEKKLKKNKKLTSALKNYKNGWKSLEKQIQDETGNKNFKFPYRKFTLSDFL
tara:strand:- start:295 stop:543 length:249 start_codon:yes stop_codon:yes gene_type:complete